jgi:hypothetical protein
MKKMQDLPLPKAEPSVVLMDGLISVQLYGGCLLRITMFIKRKAMDK